MCICCSVISTWAVDTGNLSFILVTEDANVDSFVLDPGLDNVLLVCVCVVYGGSYFL